MNAPAWATDKLKASSRAVRHSRQQENSAASAGVGDAPMYYSGPGSSSSLDLTTTTATAARAGTRPAAPATSSSPAAVQEAPYLTHAVRNAHGQVTLVPPDNLGRQRTVGTLDERNTLAQQQPYKPPPSPSAAAQSNKVKKKQKKQPRRKPTGPDSAILDAVINAGRKQQHQQQQQLDVGSSQAATRPMIRSHSSNRSIDTLASSSQASHHPSITSTSTTQEPATSTVATAPLIQIEPDSETTNRNTRPSSSSSSFPFPNLAAGELEMSQAQQLDSHASLVPSLLDSPPPAYPAPDDHEPTTGMPAQHSDASRPRSPSILDLDNAQDRPTSTEAAEPSSFLQSNNPSSLSTVHLPPLPILEPEEPPSPDLLNGGGSSPDPFSVAWEQDRLAGLSLDVRIGRDLARRKAALASNVISVSASVLDDLSGLDLSSTSATTTSSPLEDNVGGTGSTSTRTGREGTETNGSRDGGPRVARALSVYAGRKIALAAERRRAAEAANSDGTVISGSGSTTDRSRLPEETVVEEDEENERRSNDVAPQTPTRVPMSPTHEYESTEVDTPVKVEVPEKQQQQEEGEEPAEEEEETEASDDDKTPSPARVVPISAHRQFAEAAERRMAAMKISAERGSAETTTDGLPLSKHDTSERRCVTDPILAESSRRSDGDDGSIMLQQLFPKSARTFGSKDALEQQQHQHQPSTIQSAQAAPRPESLAAELVIATTRSETPPPLAAPSQPETSTPVRTATEVIPMRNSLTRSPAISNIASFASSPTPLASAQHGSPPTRSPTSPEHVSRAHSSVEERMLPLRWAPPRPVAQLVPPRVPDMPPPVDSMRRVPPPVPPPRSSLTRHPRSFTRQPLYSNSDPELLNGFAIDHETSRLPRPLSPDSSIAMATSATSAVPLHRRPSVHRRPAPPPPSPPQQSSLSSFSLIPATTNSSPSSSATTYRRRRPLPIPPSSSADVYGTPLSWSSTSVDDGFRGVVGEERRDAFGTLMRRMGDHDVARQRRETLERLEGGRGESIVAPTAEMSSRIGQDVVEGSQGSMTMQRSKSEASSVDELPEEPTRQMFVSTTMTGTMTGATLAARAPEPEVDAVNEVQQPNIVQDSAMSTNTAHEDANASSSLPVRPQEQELGQFTELDLLLARLERDQASSGGAADDGTNYDDLNLLGEVMGPAKPPGATQQELETLAVARVECERRRIDKHGKVKVKLSVVGVRCVDCGICLSRFKVDDLAVVLPNCLHAFHEQCITSWLARNRQCPFCRVNVFDTTE
ncbi:hypothetical protein ACM66B_003518 [Microbotryomycetes sp. NB124-2]